MATIVIKGLGADVAEVDIDAKAAEYLVLRIDRFCPVSASVRARLLKL